jgi:hypothetical protein
VEKAPVGGSTELRRFDDDGRIPNNPKLPLVVYRIALAPSHDLAKAFEKRFAENGWTNSWRNGVFTYHHYHSNTHEVLGIAQGQAHVCFGGEAGEVLALRATWRSCPPAPGTNASPRPRISLSSVLIPTDAITTSAVAIRPSTIPR